MTVEANKGRQRLRAALDLEMASRGWIPLDKAAEIMGISLGTMRQKKHHGHIPLEALFKHERSTAVYVSKAWAEAQVALPA